MKLLWAVVLCAPFAPPADGAGVHMNRLSRSKHLSADVKVSAGRHRQQNHHDTGDVAREDHLHHKKHAHFLDHFNEMHNFRFSSSDWAKEKFELCAADTNSLKTAQEHRDPAAAVTAAGKQATCNTSQIVLKDETESGIIESCCPKDKIFCSGCAKADDDECLKCLGGFIKRNGICTACADSPGWLDGEKAPCSEATKCTNEVFRGLSSNQACCKCGGGVLSPTPFDYLPEAVVFGQEEVQAMPVPRTANYYSINSGCELSSQGLTINSATGALEFDAGCTEVGCQRASMSPQPWEIKCTVTAHQSPTLSTTAELVVSANYISYGSPFLVAAGEKTTFPAKSAMTLTTPYKMSCVPSEAESWVTMNSANGDLSVDLTKATTLSGITGNQALKGAGGGICTIFNTVLESHRQASIVLYAPREWTSFSYGTTLLYATIGEFSSTLEPTHTEGDSTLGSIPPTRFSAACKPNVDADYDFDSFTGIGELNGHTVFTVDTTTGHLKMAPSAGLSVVLDSIKTTAARRTIDLKCAIYGHYEWTPELEGSSLVTELTLQIRDDTCWTAVTGTFLAADPQSTFTSEEACRAGCRKELGCTHFFWSSSCNFVASRCLDDNTECKLKKQKVQEKIPNCGERSSCINFQHPTQEFLSGDYCPFVDNGASGPVYRKEAKTKEDTFYLTPYDEARDSKDVTCDKGWVIKQPDAALDFQDEEAEYLELHGKTVACLAAGKDIVAESFMKGTQQVPVTGISSSNVVAAISALPCGAPNITFERGEEENEEEEDGSIEPIVLDDPTTAAPDDHWLHPCECFPDTWTDAPVDDGSVSDVPAGSGNSFLPQKFEILNGEFFCEQEALLPGSEGMVILDDAEVYDQDYCETKCREDPSCNYFWEGEIMSTRQCRFYKHCTVLVREAGATGKLTAIPDQSQKYCRISNPEKCWKVTKRRKFLSAQSGNPRPNFLCSWENLIQQCDHKLLLGGVGVDSCSRCTYATVDSHAWEHKAPVATKYQHGRQMSASCWAERFAPVPVGLGNLKAETLTCISGNWYGSKGHPGLSGFACASCVQVVQYPYPQFDSQGKQELYFTNALEVQILVDAKIKMLVNKDAELETCDITLPDKVGTLRLRSLGSETHCMAKESSSSNNLKMLTCNTDKEQLFFFDGERISSAALDSFCVAVSGNNVELAKCNAETTQMFYWDENRLRVRSNPALCVAYDTGSKNVGMATCKDDADSQMWYEDTNPPLKTPEVIYKLVHDGWCGSDEMFELTVKKIEGCAISCLAKSSCGYFAFRNNGDRKDKKSLNCALFQRSDKCPDDDTYFEYNSYSVTKVDQQAAQILIATNQTLDAAHISELAFQLKNQNPKDVLKFMIADITARTWAEGQLDGKLDPIQADDEEGDNDAEPEPPIVRKSDMEVSAAAASAFSSSSSSSTDSEQADADEAGADTVAVDSDESETGGDDDDEAPSFFETQTVHNVSAEVDHLMAVRLQEALKNGTEEVEPDDKFEEEREKYGGEFPFLTNAEIEDGPGDIVYDDSWTIEDSWKAGNKSEAERLLKENEERAEASKAKHSVAMSNAGEDEKVGDVAVKADGFEEKEEQHQVQLDEDHDEAEDEVEDELDTPGQDVVVKSSSDPALRATRTNLVLADKKKGTGELTWGSRRRRNRRRRTRRRRTRRRRTRRRRTRRRRTRRRRTIMSSYRFFVVAASSVVYVTADLEHARVYMDNHYGGSSPRRMICSIVNGQLDTDPHNIGPANDYQGGGYNEGWDKYWYNWNDIHAMNAVCNSFAKVFFDKKYLYTSKREYCPAGTDLTTEMACATGAANLNLQFAGSFNGRGDHRYCLLADDGRWMVYWNQWSHLAATSPPNNNYRSVCISTTTTTTTSTNVDCVGAWQAYSPCTVTCGGGTKTRFYKISVFKVNNGKECPFQDKETFTTGCRTQACPGKSYGGWLAKTVNEVPDELKRFQSTEEPGRCMATSQDYSFIYKTCTKGVDRDQLMEAGSLSTLLWDKFKLSMTEFVPKPVGTLVSGRRRRHTSVFLQDFSILMDCGDHVIKSLSFNVNGQLGLSSSCTVGATVGAPYEYSATLTGGDQFTTMHKDGTCLTADSNDARAVMQKCKGTAGQRLYWDGKYLKTELSSSKCLVANSGTVVNFGTCQNHNIARWTFSEEKYLKNDHYGTCVTYDSEDRAILAACTSGPPKMAFKAASGVDRLARTPMVCPEGTVLSRIEKQGTELSWGCSQVANLGACRMGQSPQIDTSSTTMATALGLGTYCTEAEGLQAVNPEASKRGEWVRFRYTCCGLGGVPSSVVPTPNLVADSIAVWEGVYEPVSRDESGRLVFNQRSTFKRGGGLGNSLVFDRDAYKWCLGQDCADSDLVHPLDDTLKGDKWQTVALSDFDGEFEAKGVKKPAPAGKLVRQPPKLIEFGSTKPEYAPECKDDVTPGTSSFKEAKQWEVSAGLADSNPDNPCASQGGEKPKGGEAQGQGTWWIADTLSGSKKTDAGITYKKIGACWQRDFDRALAMEKHARTHTIVDGVLTRVNAVFQTLFAAVPDAMMSPIGFGVKIPTGKMLGGIANLLQDIGTAANDGVFAERQWKNANAGYNDCPPDALGMARIFCDLHCIRDAVKAGDNAILESLENAVDVMGQNMDLLGEHFAGVETDEINEVKDMLKELVPTSMQQIGSMRSHLIPMFTEMHGFVVNKPFDESTSLSVRRALDGYSEAFASEHRKPKQERFSNVSLSQHLSHVTRRTEELHAMLRQVSEMSFPKALQVERNAAHYAERMIRVLGARTSMLGVYRNVSNDAKATQLWILERARPSEDSVMQELLEESTQTAVKHLDIKWWTMREAVDRYLWAADKQMKTYHHAVSALQEYTTKCSVGFSSLRGLYKKVKRDEEEAHKILKETWDKTVPMLGALAAQVRDTDLLSKFLRADVGQLTRNTSLLATETACSDQEGFTKSIHHQLFLAAARGLWGQTMKQLKLTFLELQMLEDRMVFGGLGHPYGTADIDDAWASLKESERESQQSLNMIAKATSKAWRKQHCGAASGHIGTDKLKINSM
mmetsp:Transcript_36162/g.78222  ORF Transcript_36162/g.78222 Transcript_36162/m.78222 type:complete len:3042 (-) Transcript_36162:155-9280(-)